MPKVNCSHPICMFGRNADFLAKFAGSGGRFVIVGGIAVRFYIPQREADDLDVLIDPTEHNAQLVIDAVNSGGGYYFDISASRLTKRNVRWPVKRDYYLDILTPNEATEFDAVWTAATEAEVAHQPLPVPVRVAPIPTLIAMMKSSQNPKHIQDISSLSKLLAFPSH